MSIVDPVQRTLDFSLFQDLVGHSNTALIQFVEISKSVDDNSLPDYRKLTSLLREVQNKSPVQKPFSDCLLKKKSNTFSLRSCFKTSNQFLDEDTSFESVLRADIPSTDDSIHTDGTSPKIESTVGGLGSIIEEKDEDD